MENKLNKKPSTKELISKILSFQKRLNTVVILNVVVTSILLGEMLGRLLF